MSVCISDCLTFAFSIVGLIVALIYSLRAGSTLEKVDTDLQKELVKWINKENKSPKKGEKLNIILKDYEISNLTVHRRDNIGLLVGSILISASFLILTNTRLTSESYPIAIYALASIGLFCSWLLFLHLTSKELNNYALPRIRAIEGALSEALSEESSKFHCEFGMHNYLVKKTRTYDKTNPIWWLRFRRAFWGIILFLLSFAWMWLSLT